MSITSARQAGAVVSTSLDTSSDEAAEETVLLVSSFEVASGDVATDDGGAVLAIAGLDALATGEATRVAGSAEVSVDTAGPVSAASASAEVEATGATSEGGSAAFAAAETTASVSGLAGAGISLSHDTLYVAQHGEDMVWSASSAETVQVVSPSAGTGGWTDAATEEDPWAGWSGTEPAEPEPAPPPDPANSDEVAPLPGDAPDLEYALEANTVLFWAEATAFGTDTLVTVEVSALAIGDLLSSLSISAIAISA